VKIKLIPALVATLMHCCEAFWKLNYPLTLRRHAT